ncbi:MAG: amidohydrolase [Cyclobacteriaceae bacterium]|nr:amidohydrolase [Cyclobacteriaceae bacterium]
MTFRILALLFLFVLWSSCGFAQDLVISQVHVVTLETGKILENQTLLVKDGKIESIVPSGNLPKAWQQVTRIEGKGSYVYPGLAEFHAHLPVAADGNHIALRDKLNAGELIGPRVYISGPSFNANSVTDPAQGAAMVKSQKQEGYDHLKIHPGVLSDEMKAIATAAKAENIPFGGHVPLDVGIHQALEDGFKSIEHMDGYMEGLLPSHVVIDVATSGPFNLNLSSQVDWSKLPELIQKTLNQGTYLAPTLTLFDRYFGYIPADTFRLAPEMKYLPGLQIQQWVNTKKQLERAGMLNKEVVAPYLAFRRKLFLEMHRAGVPMIMASDSPQVFNVPGFSIHHEIALMSEAGMSNLEILKTGSLVPAQYMGASNNWGQIKEGFEADFVLVEQNPLLDLKTLQKPMGVVIRGKWLGREELQSHLDRIEKNHLRN